jgi:hypothetical protein
MAYEWQLNGQPITTARNTGWTSTLTLEEQLRGYTLSCTVVDKGKVVGGTSEATSIKSTTGTAAIPCTVTKTSIWCDKNAEIEAKGLPWVRELALESDTMRNHKTSSSNPEWTVRCKGTNGNYEDFCKAASNLGIHNLSGVVEETYDSATPVGNGACVNAGGSSKFITHGTERPLEVEGGALRIYKAPPEWQLSKFGLLTPTPVSWSGSIKLTYKNWAVECSDTAGGHAGLGGNGEVTSISFSSCHGTYGGAECEKAGPVMISAVNAPWASELTETGESYFDVMKSAGSGAPGLQTHCRVLGVIVEGKTCSSLSGKATNAVSGVELSWNSDETMECGTGEGKEKGKIEGSETVKSSEGTVEVRSWR